MPGAPIEEAASASLVLFLAVIQGLSEFLPISSSGHLVLAQVALDVRGAGLALDVALHVGTLLAVLVVYRADVLELALRTLRGDLGPLAWLVVATLPAATLGFLIKDRIEGAFHTPFVAGVGLLFTAAALLLAERARRRACAAADAHDDGDPAPVGPASAALEFPSLAVALAIGLAQMLALAPGVSRAGMTIAAGLLLGLPGVRAARLSFLMSIPAVTGAALVALPEAASQGLAGISTGLLLAAIGLAALVGWGALRILLITLGRGAFRWFAAYCALLGTAALVFLE